MALTWLAPMAPFRALPISTPTATLSSGRFSRLAIGRRFARFRTISLVDVDVRVATTVGFGAGVGAFKTALWQMGVFNTNQMREPVQALEGEDVAAIRAVLEQNGMM